MTVALLRDPGRGVSPAGWPGLQDAVGRPPTVRLTSFNVKRGKASRFGRSLAGPCKPDAFPRGFDLGL